jgi:hypothetical protein
LIERLNKRGTNKFLVKAIIDHLQCFGPGKAGPNLLVNKYLPHSLFARLQLAIDPESP